MFTPAQKPRGLARMTLHRRLQSIESPAQSADRAGESVEQSQCGSAVAKRAALYLRLNVARRLPTHRRLIRIAALVRRSTARGPRSVRSQEFATPGQFADVSTLIAPPYDVLDEAQQGGAAGASTRTTSSPSTCPYLPPKTVGPGRGVREGEHRRLQAWLPARHPRSATRGRRCTRTRRRYEHNGKTLHRRGFIALVQLSPFGAGARRARTRRPTRARSRIA